jgi:hypothetical protein
MYDAHHTSCHIHEELGLLCSMGDDLAMQGEHQVTLAPANGMGFDNDVIQAC